MVDLMMVHGRGSDECTVFQCFCFFLVSFFWCVFIIVVRGLFPGMIILGENITFKAFFCPYCKRKTKTLFYFFFPSIDASKHSWFFVLNINSLTALAVQNGHHWCIFSYIFILNPFFCMIWIVLGFGGFKEISESKGRIVFRNT